MDNDFAPRELAFIENMANMNPNIVRNLHRLHLLHVVPDHALRPYVKKVLLVSKQIFAEN